MKHLTCLIIFFIIHFTLFAQKGFDPGYIIVRGQDTTKGFIEVSLNRDLTHSVKFKKGDNGELKEYTPGDLTGFGTGNDRYLSLHFLNTAQDSVMETAFVKQLVKGEYSLYSYSKDDQVFYLVQKDTAIYFLYDRFTSALGEIDKEGNYLNYLNLISINCEKINQTYTSVGYSEKNLADFIQKVDDCSSNVKAVNYYQKPKSAMQSYAFIGGFPPSLTQFTANFTLQISLPRVYKNIFFNIGLNYSYTTKKEQARDYGNELITITNNYNIISIPFTIQWNFTTSRLQPYFYAGLSASIYNETSDYGNYGEPSTPQPFVVAMVTGLGIQMRIGSQFYIRAEEVCNINGQYEMEFQNPAIGIAYRF
jgi:hypothetical protein